MKALIQRVTSAKVEVSGKVIGEIGKGLLVLLCAVRGDTEKDLEYIIKKVSQLRVFEDDQGKMNRSVLDVKGGVLAVPQFTLAASVKKGNRPSFEEAEAPERAKRLCERFSEEIAGLGIPVQRGEFGAMMQVSLVNDGPVTIMLDSRER